MPRAVRLAAGAVSRERAAVAARCRLCFVCVRLREDSEALKVNLLKVRELPHKDRKSVV